MVQMVQKHVTKQTHRLGGEMIPTDLKLYTTAEVAEILRLSVYRVRQLIRLGRLKGYCHLAKCNTKRIFVVESDLKDFLYGDFLEAYWKGNRRPQARQDERQGRIASGGACGETEQS